MGCHAENEGQTEKRAMNLLTSYVAYEHTRDSLRQTKIATQVTGGTKTGVFFNKENSVVSRCDVLQSH